MLQIALDLRRTQQLVDAFGLRESVVDAKADVRRELQVDAMGNLSPQIFLVSLKCGDHLIGIAAAHRHHVNGGKSQVCGDPHFRNRDDVPFDDWVMYIAPGQHLSDCMSHQLADTKLPARWWRVDAMPRSNRGKVSRDAVREACAARPPLDLTRILQGR